MQRKVRWTSGNASRFLAVGVIGLFLWLAFRDVSFTKVHELVSQAGLECLVVLVPFALVQLWDSLGYSMLLRSLSKGVAYGRVLRAQVAGELLTMSLPMGFVVGESIRPVILSEVGELGLDRAIAGTAGRKYLLVLAEGLVVLSALVLSWPIVGRLSEYLFGRGLLYWISLGIGSTLLLIALSLVLGLRHGQAAQGLFRFIAKYTPRRWQDRVNGWRDEFFKTDQQLGVVFRLPAPRLLLPGAIYLGVWLIEAFETWLILNILGVHIDFLVVLYIESTVSFLRSVVAIVPAGLGVQDAGYVGFLLALGVPNAVSVGAAFSLLKRFKEVTWAGIGCGWLVLTGSTNVTTAHAELR